MKLTYLKLTFFNNLIITLENHGELSKWLTENECERDKEKIYDRATKELLANITTAVRKEK